MVGMNWCVEELKWQKNVRTTVVDRLLSWCGHTERMMSSVYSQVLIVLFVCIYPRFNCQGYQRAHRPVNVVSLHGKDPGTLRFQDNHDENYATEATVLIARTSGRRVRGRQVT